ncbi:hypothetical protein RND71_041035 [Anisodus tanguticus]|uniref:DUF3444 domain-containing protein n=1 Tax=Anisodus tanguticus TaxID=243964 RepID=A0AAE1QV23_9SOLA|nr:hypothetical protein RND71_041035 [Anisodus tanguticus]
MAPSESCGLAIEGSFKSPSLVRGRVLPDGSISYGGGITDQVIAKTGIKYNDFVNAVFDRLGIDPSDRIFHFTVKFDRSELIRLRDQESVNTLLQFNDGFAHVYASSLEEEPKSRPPSSHAKKAARVDYSDSKPDTTPVGDDENDLATPLKKAQFQSAGDSKPLMKKAVGGDDQKHAGVTRSCSNSVERLNQNGVDLPKGHVQNNNSKIGTVNEQASILTSGSTKQGELIVYSDPEPDTIPDSNPPELWACHGADFMPRFYAHIRKVSGPEFKIKLRWLEAHPEDQRERAWVRADLPVGCGKFRRGNCKYTSDRLIFSHQVQCEKDERGMYIVYPRKGETWTLFKDWDIDWSSDPKSLWKYKYEVVEILSDYVKNVGVKIGYLDKVTGFVSLFRRTKLTVLGSFCIKPKELYKFSRRIPSKMTGSEREGVPVGSFELDPASLPLNPDDIWCPGKVKEERRTARSGTEREDVPNILSAIPLGTRDKSRNATTSLKSGDLNGIHATDGESSKVRILPRGVNICEKKRTLMSSHSGSDNPSPDFCDKCVKDLWSK